MKKLIMIIAFSALIPLIGVSSNEPEVKKSKAIFSELLQNEGIECYRIPVCLIKFVLRFDSKADDIIPLFDGASSIKIALCEDEFKDYRESYKRICRGLETSLYSDLVNIVDKRSIMTIKALYRNEFIHELVIMIREDHNLVAISMKGKIDPKRIANTIAKLNNSKIDQL